ncbi:MAG: DUF1552 domain-containing protein [Planctomycetes bacterium]|nr:DUF1552 domain-containing protein [Planctomycetota bacterium]
MTLPACSRRTFLRGTGATLCLPWLEGLAPKRPPAFPTRLAILVMPNGALPSAWHAKPAAFGGWEPSFILQPLAKWRTQVTVLRGLANKESIDGDGHYAKVAPLLTGVKIRRTGGRDLHNAESMDQVAARHLGATTPLPSLELGCDPIYPVEDMGYSSIYGGSIAWSAADRPLPKEIVPARVFDRLFRSQALAADATRASVLDAVRADANRLRARLGRRDQQRLAEFEDSVRALERRIEATAARGAAPAIDGKQAPPDGAPADHATHVELMTDLIALAFATDATRVVTFLLANEVSGRDFSFLPGCAGGFHDFSHHEGKEAKKRPYATINRWYVERWAALLDKLAALPEGDGTVLDHSFVVFASAMSDGNEHSPHDLPILLAGRGDGTLPQGRLVRSPRDTPLCRLWLSLLQRTGCPVERFGDADVPLL